MTINLPRRTSQLGSSWRFLLAVVLLSSGVGYAVAINEALILVAGAVISAILVICWPAHILLVWIPFAALRGPSLIMGITISMAVVAGLGTSLALGVLVNRWRFQLVHLLTLGLTIWLLFSYTRPAIGTQSLTFSSERHVLPVVILGLLLVSVVGAIHVPLRSLLTATCIYGVVAAVPIVVTWRPGTRAAAFGLNPNYLGLALGIGFVAMLGQVVRLRRPLWIPGLLVTGSALMCTSSRGALTSAGFGAAIVLLSGRSRRLQVAAFVVLIGLATFVPGETVRTSFFSNRSNEELTYNSHVRMRAAVTAMRVTIDRPILGLGYGNFAPYALADPDFGYYMNTHNDYLRLAAETGLLGLALFVALLLPVWRAGNRLDTWNRIAVAVIATWGTGLLTGNFLSNLQVSAPVWVLLGSLWHINACARGTCGASDAVEHDREDSNVEGASPARKIPISSARGTHVGRYGYA